MFLLNFVLFSIFVTFVAAEDAAQGIPGELSKKHCQEYSRYVRQQNQCSATVSNEGRFASKGEFSHMVMLGAKSGGDITWHCGGSLISEEFVLVAAHCLTSISGTPELVRAGVTFLNDSEHAQDIKIKEIIVHPDYRKTSLHNDIGLVKLENKVDINENILPACLHTHKDIKELIAIGSLWGPKENFGGLEQKLQKVVLRFVDQEKCNNYFKSLIDSKMLRNGITYETMVCAGPNSTAVTELRGGGPLQILHKDYPCMYDILGTGSFGKTADGPTVFTRVSAYIPWIEEKVWK